MQIEITYATPDAQTVVAVEVANGATVADALTEVATQPPFCDLDLDTVPVGIYGETVTRERVLKPGDRVELYRPLVTDPLQARRQRAAAAKPR